MNMHRTVCRIAIAILIFTSSATSHGRAQHHEDASAKEFSAVELSAGEIAALIEQLADPDFDTRQRATESLVAAGAAAEQQLNNALKSADPEVVSRCRLALATIQERKIEQRKQAFLNGEVEQLEQHAQLWDHFQEIAGDSPETRDLFVRMQHSFGGLLDILESDSENASELVNTLCIAKSRSFGEGGKAQEHVFAASIAFAAVQTKLQPISTCRGSGTLSRYGKMYGYDDPVLRALLGAWTDRCTGIRTESRVLSVASSYGLDEATGLARKMLADPTSHPMLSVRVLAAASTADDVSLIEPWIEHAANQKTRSIRKSELRVCSGDTALAACVHLTGQSLEEYGFQSVDASAAPTMVSRFGFASDVERKNARMKWKAWRESTVDSQSNVESR